MKNITVFYLKILKFLEEKCSIYLNRRVFVMIKRAPPSKHLYEAQAGSKIPGPVVQS